MLGYVAVRTSEPSVIPHCDLPGGSAEEPLGTRQAHDMDRGDEEDVLGRSRRGVQGRGLHQRPQRAGSEVGRSGQHVRALKA